MKDLIYKKRDVIGLDIGTTSVKFAQLKTAGKLTKLVGYGRLDVPKDIIIEGIISEPEKLATVLEKNFKNPPWGKINAKRVIASLPESRIFTRIITLPTMGRKETDDAVRFEIEQSVPIPLSDLYIDWVNIDQVGKEMMIFFSAAPKAIVDSYVQLFRKLSLDPMALEISTAAIARSMISNKDASEPVLIIDIGGRTTNLAVFDSALRVTESHPTGGLKIRENVKNELGIGEEEAARIVRAGLKKDSKAFNIIESELKSHIEKIEKMINYFTEQSGGKKISKILVCGGLGFIPGFTEMIKSTTKIEARVGNPWVNISIYPLKPVPKEEAPGFAAAIGLCLRGLND